MNKKRVLSILSAAVLAAGMLQEACVIDPISSSARSRDAGRVRLLFLFEQQLFHSRCHRCGSNHRGSCCDDRSGSYGYRSIRNGREQGQARLLVQPAAVQLLHR